MISILACSLDGAQITVDLVPGTILRSLHRSDSVVERARCNYGLVPELDSIASSAGMIVSGRDESGEVRAVERPDHPFFVATLYQPQLRSAPDAPHPVLAGLVHAAGHR